MRPHEYITANDCVYPRSLTRTFAFRLGFCNVEAYCNRTVKTVVWLRWCTDSVRLSLTVSDLNIPYITKPRLCKYIVNFTSKNEYFQMKTSDIFHISAKNIDCWYSLEPPRRGGSTEYPQSMFLSRNKKNNVYPCKPMFYYVKVGFMGVKII